MKKRTILLGLLTALWMATAAAFAQGHGGFTPNGQGGYPVGSLGQHGGHGAGYGSKQAFQWRGRVDDMVDVSIRGGRVQYRTVSGKAAQDVDYQLRRDLPRRNVNVSVQKLKGRGAVYVLQQPRSNNDYTAVIRIVDKDGGADDYRFNAQW
jgi:hypothetical protein